MKVIKIYTVEVDTDYTTVTQGDKSVQWETGYFRRTPFSHVIKRFNSRLKK